MSDSLEKAFKHVIKFVGLTGLRFRIVYFGAGSTDENNEKVWDLLSDVGTVAISHMENFTFVVLPCWTRFKLAICCRNTLPTFLSHDTVFRRHDAIRELLRDYYQDRDPAMCLKIFESLSRDQLEFYYNENQKI